jgi:hypothetical protein
VEELIKELGEEIRLEELAAVISAPGAPRQVLHADTPWTSEALLYTTPSVYASSYMCIYVSSGAARRHNMDLRTSSIHHLHRVARCDAEYGPHYLPPWDA